MIKVSVNLFIRIDKEISLIFEEYKLTINQLRKML